MTKKKSPSGSEMKKEATLQEFYDFVKEQFVKVEERFASVSQQLITLNDGQVVLGQDLKALTYRVGIVEEKVDEMQGALDDALVTLVDHDGRIEKLEMAHT
jgi:5-bromo-4-chloroindolyl phosphate hydrolysis protein